MLSSKLRCALEAFFSLFVFSLSSFLLVICKDRGEREKIRNKNILEACRNFDDDTLRDILKL